MKFWQVALVSGCCSKEPLYQSYNCTPFDTLSLITDGVDLVDDGITVYANGVVQCGYSNISWTGASVSDLAALIAWWRG